MRTKKGTFNGHNAVTYLELYLNSKMHSGVLAISVAGRWGRGGCGMSTGIPKTYHLDECQANFVRESLCSGCFSEAWGEKRAH